MLTPESDENTEKLSTRAHALINAEFSGRRDSRSIASVIEETKAPRDGASTPRKPALRVPRTKLSSAGGSATILSSQNAPISPQIQSSSTANQKNAVKTARKKIQEEWEALKNATIISNESPASETPQVLNGVVAYIEINNVPKSIAFKVILESLGATVKDNFTPEVTHVIFKRGTLETFKRAKLLNVYLVSVLWIEACKSSKKKIPEDLFPVADHTEYASPMTFKKFLAMDSEERGNLITRATQQNTRDKQKETTTTNETNQKRVTRSTGKSPSNSSESALVLRISSDDSGKKNDKNANIIDKSPNKRRLFASAGDETIDHDGAKKKILDSKMKRKLFTHRLDDSTMTGDNSSDSSRINLREINPYQVPGKQKIARKKKNVQKKTVNRKEKETEVKESSTDSSSENSDAEKMEQVKELIKMTQQTHEETTKKQKKEKKRRLIKEKKKKKLTKEEKENIRKANKMARRQENQVIKASQPRSCKKVNVYSKGIKNPSLVSTFLHKTENRWLRDSINTLGVFTFKAAVESDTTHVVAGLPVRTINLLKGLARGCWLVDKRWVEESLLAGHWLTEHEYELANFSPAVRKCRIERQVLGDDYHMDIFQRCGGIFIGDDCIAKRKDLRALVSLCSGRLVSQPLCAEVVVGAKVDQKTCVSDLWILDSIAAGRRKCLKKYVIA